MNNATNWYIIKSETQQCEIINLDNTPEYETYWGPFLSQEEAIARRIGLIRAGKCQPQ